MLEDRAYNLIRRWRRGEINGNQFDYNLALLGVSEEFCYSVTKARDTADLRALARETALLAGAMMIMLVGTTSVSANLKDWRRDGTAYSQEATLPTSPYLSKQ